MFYDVFAELCAKKGIAPGKAADEIGINRSNVTSWKKSGYTPRGDSLSKIAKYFNVTVDYLTGKDDDSSSSLIDVDLSKVDIGFLGDYKVLTEENKAVLRDMVRLMRERQGGEK